jgi:hypothetical protein
VCDAATASCIDTGRCSRHADCATNMICQTGRCQSAYGRLYEITVVNATFPQQMPGGGSWDGSGAVDLFMKVYVDGEEALTTATRRDTYSPVWDETAYVQLLRGSPALRFELWDEDAVSDDLLAAWQFDGGVSYASILAVGFNLTATEIPGLTIQIQVVPAE